MSATSESHVRGAGLTASASGITPPSLPPRQGVFLSDVIVELGFADHETVEEAVRAAAASGKPFDHLLLENGVLDGEQLMRAVAERNGLDRVDLDRFDLDPVAATLIGRSAAMRYSALPIAIAPDGALVVAVADPSDFLGVSDIEVMAKMEVRLVIANLGKIQALIADLPDDPVQATIERALTEAPSANEDVVEISPPVADQGDEAGPTEIEQLRQELLDAAEERERLREEVDQLREGLSATRSEGERLREEVERASREREPQLAESRHPDPGGEDVAREQLSRAEVAASGAIALGEVTLDEERGTATVPVCVESAGRLILSGKGVRDSSVILAAAERTNLEVIPKEKKRRKLDESGRAKVEVNITFVPDTGEPHAQVLDVRLVKHAPPRYDLQLD
jgi:type II secretion system (T2SS) protein E